MSEDPLRIEGARLAMVVVLFLVAGHTGMPAWVPSMTVGTMLAWKLIR